MSIRSLELASGVLLKLLSSVSILIFFGSKSSKLIIFAGVAHNVLSIFNSLIRSEELVLYIDFFIFIIIYARKCI